MRGGVAATIVSCLQVRLWSGQPVPQWRKSAARPQGHAALKTVEGPPAPPLLKVRNRMFYQKIEKTNCVSLRARWAGRCAERRVAWPWRRRRFLFSLSYCVGKTLKSVNVCLQCPVFNALGAAVCRPQWLAGRWAGRRAERRVAWPWWRRRFFFLCRIVLAKR